MKAVARERDGYCLYCWRFILAVKTAQAFVRVKRITSLSALCPLLPSRRQSKHDVFSMQPEVFWQSNSSIQKLHGMMEEQRRALTAAPLKACCYAVFYVMPELQCRCIYMHIVRIFFLKGGSCVLHTKGWRLPENREERMHYSPNLERTVWWTVTTTS